MLLREISDAQLRELYEERGLGEAQVGEGDVTGPVSKVAEAFGSVATLAQGIPVVSQLAKPVKWVADAVGGLASIFGLSKESNHNTVTYVNPIFGRFMENSDGQDNSRMLALSVMNRIDSSQMIPEVADEMSLGYIKRRRAYIGRTEVGDDLEGGALVARVPVTPVTDIVHVRFPIRLLDVC
jgi:hypothetical protein